MPVINQSVALEINNNKLLQYFIDIKNIDINIQKIKFIEWFLLNYSHKINNETILDLECKKKLEKKHRYITEKFSRKPLTLVGG